MEKTQSTRPEVSGPTNTKTNIHLKVELDFEPLKLTSMADFQALLGDDDLKEDSDDDDVFEAGEEMDEDIQEPKIEETQSHHSTKHTTEEEHQSPLTNKD
ncbi:hypothetical protein Tco_0492209 [Tanacetum coccineum]